VPTEPEPTGWELQRALDRIWTALNEAENRAEKHISTESLAALLAPIRQELRHLGEEVASERSMRQADYTALKDWAKTEHDRVQEWANEAISRIEKAFEKEQVEHRKREDDRKADAREAAKERRADRRVLIAAALAAGASVLLWILDRIGGVA